MRHQNSRKMIGKASKRLSNTSIIQSTRICISLNFHAHLLLRRLKSSLTASYFLSRVPYMMLMDSLGPPSALSSSWCCRRSSDISLRSSSRNLENFPMKYFESPSEKEFYRLRLRVSWSRRWFSMTTSLYRVRRFSAS